MKIYIIGNPLVKEDSLPLKLLPKLRKSFPKIIFEEADPNENFVPEDGSVIVDTVVGIKKVQLFDNIEDFVRTRSVSPHDYDLGFHLRLMLKLGKIRNVKILGVPFDLTISKVAKKLSQLLNQFTST
ncbi:MAG: hypothetical protein AAB874_00155 [Patescibacteria group bacterium]